MSSKAQTMGWCNPPYWRTALHAFSPSPVPIAATCPPPPPPRSTTGMLFYNSMLSLPMLLLAVLLKGEPWSMTSYPLLWNPQVGRGGR